MPEVQRIEALIAIVDKMLAVQEAELKRHGDMANRDVLKECRTELDKLKKDR